MGTAIFSANANYYLDVDANLESQNVAGNFSTIYWRVLVVKANAYGHVASTNTGNSGWADSNMGGDRDLWNDGNLAYNFQNGANTGTFVMADGRFNVPHRADGTAEYFVNGSMTLANLGGAGAGTGIRGLPRIADVPPAPSPIGFGLITQTAIQYRFLNNGDNGSPIREWQALIQEAPNGEQLPYSSDGGTLREGLKPGMLYNFWARGRNDIGWGPWSVMASARTAAGVRLHYGGEWKEAVPYIKVNGVWRLARPYSKTNGEWRPTI